jgi:5'-nucleotidase (lipoprotein e(P4) family)
MRPAFFPWTPLALLVLLGPPMAAQAQPAPASREIKWMRDSREYVELTRQIYGQAAAGVRALAAGEAGPWAVVMDLDETVLDNSVYQLDRAAYGVPFDTVSWNAWVRRAEAGAVPGAAEFIAAVRRAGGRLAFLSGREESVAGDTRRNLAALGLTQDGDLICLRDAAGAYTKRARRAEIRLGRGRCAWNTPVRVLAYVGDAMGDFPEPDEEPGTFGQRFFLLPNPMYGGWERGVTR